MYAFLATGGWAKWIHSLSTILLTILSPNQRLAVGQKETYVIVQKACTLLDTQSLFKSDGLDYLDDSPMG